MRVLLICLAVLAGCSTDNKTTEQLTEAPANAIEYTRAELGEKWPLKIESIRVHCVDGSALVGLGNDGTLYAINGLARSYLKDKGTESSPISDVQIVGKSISVFRNTCTE